MILTEQVKAACDSTRPKTTARNNALAKIRWVLRDQNGSYAGLDSQGRPVSVTAIKDAMVFDGRDNEKLKRDFYGRITGNDYTVELLPV